MRRRDALVLLCLVFSGLTALVYQIIWTRLLGFAVGTTTEAISTVLAVFFGGLALGNLIAAKRLTSIVRPFFTYALLEGFIGLYAWLSLPLLKNLDAIYGWVGVPESELGLIGLRIAMAVTILLPPTIAMGATLPVIARALVVHDSSIGKGSARLYAANTFGAVLGAYGCGFWGIPFLGLQTSVALSGAVNIAVALVIAMRFGTLRVSASPSSAATATPLPRRVPRAAYLFCFGVSGFVAIGYEIVWSKVFGIVFEGTLYGFATVLSGYLLGIGCGSLLIAGFVDRIKDLARAFALFHVAVGVAVALGIAAVPYLPYVYHRLAEIAPNSDAIHLLYLIALPIVLLPTALFGAAFPILMRLDTQRAEQTGESFGIATAINTAGSIAASLVVGFWWIPRLGMDATLYALLLIDFIAAILLLMRSEQSAPKRLRTLVGTAAVVGTVSLSFGGVRIEHAIAGRALPGLDFASYQKAVERSVENNAVTLEGRTSIVSVVQTNTARHLKTNGLPEAGFDYDLPYSPTESMLLGVVPYAFAENAERALIIGLGGANTLHSLLRTELTSVDVVELEQAVVDATALLNHGRADPFADPRVTLRVADGRNDLLLRRWANAPRYDLITSQPSHPWRIGAANLFTEEFFEAARNALNEGGVFGAWLNVFRMDEAALLSVINSFEHVFPGAVFLNVGHHALGDFLLLGGTHPIQLDMARIHARMDEPVLKTTLAAYSIDTPEDLLKRFNGPLAPFAAIAPQHRNTDNNAFVETHTPRRLAWRDLEFHSIEARVPEASVLPPIKGTFDARRIAEHFAANDRPESNRLERFLTQQGDTIGPLEQAVLRALHRLRHADTANDAIATLHEIAEQHPNAPEPLRAIAAHHAKQPEGARAAGQAFGDAYIRSGKASDAYAAGRALLATDAEAAWHWFERIPNAQYDAFPALVQTAAERALQRGAPRSELTRHDAALRRSLTEHSLQEPRVHEVAAQIAFALGDITRGRAHIDLDARRRNASALLWFKRSAQAIAQGDWTRARAALAQAQALVPSHPKGYELAASLALHENDPAALERALDELQRWAPAQKSGRARANHFRTENGLPLLPDSGLAPSS